MSFYPRSLASLAQSVSSTPTSTGVFQRHEFHGCQTIAGYCPCPCGTGVEFVVIRIPSWPNQPSLSRSGINRFASLTVWLQACQVPTSLAIMCLAMFIVGRCLYICKCLESDRQYHPSASQVFGTMCIPIASIYVFFYPNICHKNQPNGICKKGTTATSLMYQAFDALLSPWVVGRRSSIFCLLPWPLALWIWIQRSQMQLNPLLQHGNIMKYLEIVAKKIPSRELTYPPPKWHFEDDFPFPKVGYVNSLEGI